MREKEFLNIQLENTGSNYFYTSKGEELLIIDTKLRLIL